MLIGVDGVFQLPKSYNKTTLEMVSSGMQEMRLGLLCIPIYSKVNDYGVLGIIQVMCESLWQQ